MGWYRATGIAAHLLTPTPSYADYRTETEVLEELVGALSHGIEAIRDQRHHAVHRRGDGGRPSRSRRCSGARA